MLSLQNTIAGNQPFLQQLKKDYFPLFDQNTIAYLTLGKELNTLSQERRDYLGCLVGTRFFNYHLKSINAKDDKSVQFEIGDVKISDTSQIVNVKVSYFMMLLSSHLSFAW